MMRGEGVEGSLPGFAGSQGFVKKIVFTHFEFRPWEIVGFFVQAETGGSRGISLWAS